MNIGFICLVVYTENMIKLTLQQLVTGNNTRIMKQWNILKTEKDYSCAIERLDEIFDVAPGDLFFEEAELLGLLINEYEDVHFPISFRIH